MKINVEGLGFSFLILISRYCAVCRPVVYRNRSSIVTSNNNRISRITKYVLLILALSTLYNIPKFLETELVSFITISLL